MMAIHLTGASGLLLFLCVSTLLHAASPSPDISEKSFSKASSSSVQADLDVVLDFSELDYLGPDTRLCNCTYSPTVGVRQPVWGNVAIALHEGVWHTAVLRQHFGFHDSGISGAIDNVHTIWGLSSVLHCNISNPREAAAYALAPERSAGKSRLSSPSIWFHPSDDRNAGSGSGSTHQAAHAHDKYVCSTVYPSLESYR